MTWRVPCGAAPGGRVGVMVVSPTRNDQQPGKKETACGAVSLRQHCPDQVPGGRRSASGLSPASQPFLPAPDLPGTPFGPAPSITSQTISTLHGAYDGRLGSKARPARAKGRVSPKPAASRDGGVHASRSGARRRRRREECRPAAGRAAGLRLGRRRARRGADGHLHRVTACGVQVLLRFPGYSDARSFLRVRGPGPGLTRSGDSRLSE